MKQMPATEEEILSIKSKLSSSLDDIKGRRIAIVGDVGMDEYVLGEVKRISPEAPVPVLDVHQQDQRLGLAANVAQNISSLGGEPVLLAVVGNDEARSQLFRMLESAQVDTSSIVTDPERPTTRKLRVMAEHHHIVRVDYERRRYLQPDVEKQLLQNFDDVLESCDGVIIEDYAKGVLSESVCQRVIQKSNQLQKKVLVDPAPSTPIEYYRGTQLMTPNRDEAFKLSELNVDDLRETKDSLIEVGHSILKKVEAKNLVVTRGKEGMTLFEADLATHLPTFARQVFDVTGAGDTVIAALALGWSAGWSLTQACVFANIAAGIVVSQVGCVPCSLDELKDSLNP